VKTPPQTSQNNRPPYLVSQYSILYSTMSAESDFQNPFENKMLGQNNVSYQNITLDLFFQTFTLSPLDRKSSVAEICFPPKAANHRQDKSTAAVQPK